MYVVSYYSSHPVVILKQNAMYRVINNKLHLDLSVYIECIEENVICKEVILIFNLTWYIHQISVL